MKKYRVRERAHEELLSDLLHTRGVVGDDAIAKFLQPDFERDSHDPFLLPDMEVAIERIFTAIKNNEQVCVWSDYDCDGIPGGVLLATFLRDIGLRVRHYIPHRHKEGYGLNNAGLDDCAEQGITLVITVDLGITDCDQVAHAREKNIDVIITDHHIVPTEIASNVSPQNPPLQMVWPRLADRAIVGERGEPRTFVREDFAGTIATPVREILPDAIAVIDAKRADSRYPFDGLCGAGVAWKLVQAILSKNRFGIAEGKEKWLLDLVGISTVADMVPLVDENRMLARYGLMVLRKNRRPGLAALLSLMRTRAESITEDDIGFMIAPRINAASRMDSPHVAAELLASRDSDTAIERARELHAINDERKILVTTIVKEANKRVASDGAEQYPVIVIGSPNWRPGVLGLVANSLAEAHGKPAFVWGREGGELLRGSCRSEGVMNVTEMMRAAGDVFEACGGHFAAGGFSIHQERVSELLPSLVRAHEKLSASGIIEKEIVIDRKMELAELPFAYKELQKLAPFGVDNVKPLFLFHGVTVAKVRVFGKSGNHLELGFSREGSTCSGIAFFSGVDSFSKKVETNMIADIVGHIESDWRGQPRIRIVDIL